MTRFKATYKGRDLFLTRLPSSHVRYSALLEMDLAARWWRLTPQAFREYDTDDQAEMIAVYRVQNQIDGVLAKAQRLEAGRQNKNRRGR